VSVGFLSPGAALVGLAVVIALAVLLRTERRSRRVAAALGLAPRRGRSALPVAAALLAAGGVIALALAQPVVSGVRTQEARTDAEVIVVVDITRSMLASHARGEPTRFDRARSAAKTLRGGMPDVPTGLSSLSDRVLPHLFPSASVNTFTGTVDRVIGIERPPPDRAKRGVATQFGALGALASQNYYDEKSTRRVALVLSDGESLPFGTDFLRPLLERAHITPIFVHFWAPDERVHRAGGGVERYRPEPGTDTRLKQIAAALGGSAFREDELGKARDATRKALGEGPVGPWGEELQTRTLSVWVAPFLFVPLLFVLWRRNV
jgi:hypothetical protein